MERRFEPQYMNGDANERPSVSALVELKQELETARNTGGGAKSQSALQTFLSYYEVKFLLRKSCVLQSYFRWIICPAAFNAGTGGAGPGHDFESGFGSESN